MFHDLPQILNESSPRYDFDPHCELSGRLVPVESGPLVDPMHDIVVDQQTDTTRSKGTTNARRRTTFAQKCI